MSANLLVTLLSSLTRVLRAADRSAAPRRPARFRKPVQLQARPRLWQPTLHLSLRGGTASSNPSSSSAESATNPRHQRSSGAFTHGLVRVLGAIVGPQPLASAKVETPRIGLVHAGSRQEKPAVG